MNADDFPDLKDGDPLEPIHFNAIYDELRRWRKLSAAAPLAVDGADGDGGPVVYLTGVPPFFIKLTATYASGYAWKEVLIGPYYSVGDANVTGSPAKGNAAFERQTGDTTLTAGDTVYEARWGPGGGLTFDGKN